MKTTHEKTHSENNKNLACRGVPRVRLTKMKSLPFHIVNYITLE